VRTLLNDPAVASSKITIGAFFRIIRTMEISLFDFIHLKNISEIKLLT